jgi:hypothetical protein
VIAMSFTVECAVTARRRRRVEQKNNAPGDASPAIMNGAAHNTALFKSVTADGTGFVFLRFELPVC